MQLGHGEGWKIPRWFSYQRRETLSKALLPNVLTVQKPAAAAAAATNESLLKMQILRSYLQILTQ